MNAITYILVAFSIAAGVAAAASLWAIHLKRRELEALTQSFLGQFLRSVEQFATGQGGREVATGLLDVVSLDVLAGNEQVRNRLTETAILLERRRQPPNAQSPVVVEEESAEEPGETR